MASIRKRQTGAGKPRYQVRWVEAGAGPQATTLPTLAAAKTFRSRVEAAGERWPADTGADAPTFREYAPIFLAQRTGITERTRHDYKRDVEAYLYPAFGDLPLDMIDRAAVAQWVRSLEGKKAAKTIANLHGLLSTLLAEAVLAGHVNGNPAHGTRLPAGQREEACFLTPQEFGLVRGGLDGTARDLATVLAGTGLRWGEVTALDVRRVDLLAQTPRLRVEQAWKRQPDSTYVLGPPKTKRSRRTVTLDSEVVDALLPHLAGKTGTELVFPGPSGGAWHSAGFHRLWQAALTAAGLEKTPRVHDLRHSHASWLIAAGVPLPAIQRRLGHESIVTTIDLYGHLAPDADLGVRAAVSDALRSNA